MDQKETFELRVEIGKVVLEVLASAKNKNTF